MNVFNTIALGIDLGVGLTIGVLAALCAIHLINVLWRLFDAFVLWEVRFYLGRARRWVAEMLAEPSFWERWRARK